MRINGEGLIETQIPNGLRASVVALKEGMVIARNDGSGDHREILSIQKGSIITRGLSSKKTSRIVKKNLHLYKVV